MSWIDLLFLDCLAWTCAGLGGGWLMHRLPLRHLREDGPLTTLLSFERSGRVYQRWLRVQRWKPYLPEASNLFGRGFSKQCVHRRDRAYFQRFAMETRRAELTHWLQLAVLPWMLMFNPPSLGAVMLVYALVANLPFIIVQRHNRARLLRLVRAGQLRPAATVGPTHLRNAA